MSDITVARALKVDKNNLTIRQLKALMDGLDDEQKIRVDISAVPHDRYPNTMVTTLKLEVDVP